MSARPEKQPSLKKAKGPDSWQRGPEQKPRWMLEPQLAVLDALDVDAIAIGLTTDTRPLAGAAGYLDWRLCGRLSRIVLSGHLTGAAGEKVLMPTLGRVKAPRLFLFGWGPSTSLLDGATVRLKWMIDVLAEARVARVAIALPEPAKGLMGLVEQHLVEPLGPKLAGVFAPDPSL